MSDVILFAAPGSCSLVTTLVLEKTGLSFEYRLIRFMRGEHKSPDFKKINPKGRVPAIVIDGEALTENVAMISYLNERFPDAQLLPVAASPLDRARQLADLAFFATTVHPMLTRLRMPMFFAGPENIPAVIKAVSGALPEILQLIEDRIAAGPWWYGDTWSAIDAYIFWAFRRVEGSDFDVSAYPKLKDHSARMEARPETQRALAREAKAVQQLESEGLGGPPPSGR